MLNRCPWAVNDRMIKYHDHEWGVPVYDDNKLFEMLILEGAQAGLSWDIILSKRNNYQKVFHQFSIKKVSLMSDEELLSACKNKLIVRNKLKIFSVRKNAIAALKIKDEMGSFSDYVWSFSPCRTNYFKSVKDIPSYTKESGFMSDDLKKRGFSFIGKTIVYSFMQAIGMVNDHLVSCYRHKEIMSIMCNKACRDTKNALRD